MHGPPPRSVAPHTSLGNLSISIKLHFWYDFLVISLFISQLYRTAFRKTVLQQHRATTVFIGDSMKSMQPLFHFINAILSPVFRCPPLQESHAEQRSFFWAVQPHLSAFAPLLPFCIRNFDIGRKISEECVPLMFVGIQSPYQILFPSPLEPYRAYFSSVAVVPLGALEIKC